MADKFTDKVFEGESHCKIINFFLICICEKDDTYSGLSLSRTPFISNFLWVGDKESPLYDKY